MTDQELSSLLTHAFAMRASALTERHDGALRLFNGFTEGFDSISVELYARTAVIHDHGASESEMNCLCETLYGWAPWIQNCVIKRRGDRDQRLRNGQIVKGAFQLLDRKVREHGIWHALELTLNRDTSLYLDTRLARKWLIENSVGKRVLNTFAYTGSLGVAAIAGGATRVLQTDLNRDFLKLAKTSHTLNGFPINKADFVGADFFDICSKLRRSGELFDTVIVDPPFFSSTRAGIVDLENNMRNVLNKVRPLIADGGHLMAINNALFFPGADFERLLAELCADGYLSVESRIAVPNDLIGYPDTRTGQGWPSDPAPYVHPTKIALLHVRRKDAR